MDNREAIPVAVLRQVIESIEVGLNGPTFNLQGQRKATMLLFLSALENARAFVLLSETLVQFASIANARSAFEALIDMCSTLKDSAHLDRMHQTFLWQKRNVLKAAIGLTQRIGSMAGQRTQSLQQQLNALDEQLRSLTKVAKKRRDELISEHLGDSGELLSLWNVLCDVSHNNINSLAVRHIDGQGKVRLYAPLENTLSEGIVLVLSALLVDMMGALAVYVISGKETYAHGLQIAKNQLFWIQERPEGSA